MALVRAERVLETSTTTGTGSLSLGGPVTGYRSFASVMATNDTAYYAIVAVDSSGRPTGDWETGLGTLTGATTLTRTTVLASSNGGALVTLTSGTKQVFLTLSSTEIVNIVADLASKASATKVDVYDANDTWTKPDGAKFVDVFCISGGNGGQSGALAATNTLAGVDAAGGVAGFFGRLSAAFSIPAEVLTPTVTVTIGAGGTGGASRTTVGTGNSGTNGGASSFGSYMSVSGSIDPGGAGGGGGSVADAIGGNGLAGSYIGIASSTLLFSMTAVAYTNITNGGPSVIPTAGTAGTGASTTNATATGTAGGAADNLTGAGAGRIAGRGGGGGGAGVTSAGAATACIGGDGGNGGWPGGGGGGGGGAAAQRSSLPTGSKSGKGGDGADGGVIVVTRF